MSVFTFGKKKGSTVAEVAVSDPSYLEWMMSVVDTWNKPPSKEFINEVRNAVSSLPRSTTDEQLVSLGKYRDQPVSVLIADRPYATWLCQQPFFRNNPLYPRVSKELGIDGEPVNPYASGGSGLHLPDTNTVTFGRYKGKPLSEMLADSDYCAWVIAHEWERKPAHYDQILESARRVKPTYDDHLSPEPEDDYELDDAPLLSEEEPVEPEDDEGDDDEEEYQHLGRAD